MPSLLEEQSYYYRNRRMRTIMALGFFAVKKNNKISKIARLFTEALPLSASIRLRKSRSRASAVFNSLPTFKYLA